MAGACGGICAGPRACGSSPLRGLCGLWVDAYLRDWTLWVVRIISVSVQVWFVGAECPRPPRALLELLTQATEGGSRHLASGGTWGTGVAFHSRERHMKGSLQGGALLAQLWASPLPTLSL